MHSPVLPPALGKAERTSLNEDNSNPLFRMWRWLTTIKTTINFCYVADQVKQLTVNQRYVGSSPTVAAKHSGYSSVWPEFLPWKEDVEGSNPSTLTKLNGEAVIGDTSWL